MIVKGQWHQGVLQNRPFNRRSFSPGIYSVEHGAHDTLKIYRRKVCDRTVVNISQVKDGKFCLYVVENF